MNLPTHRGIKGLSPKGWHPSPLMEEEFRLIESAFQMARTPHWLGFGGLYGLCFNNGVIKDGDLDYATFYGQDHNRVRKAFESKGYVCTKSLMSDIDPTRCLYQGYNRELKSKHVTPEAKNPKSHVCVSYWIDKCDKLWYCHDEQHCISGTGTPDSWFFKGVPNHVVTEDSIIKVEWPGITPAIKVSVPLQSATLMDYCYIGSPFKKQKYDPVNYQLQPDKMTSLFSGGAISRYACNLKSIAQFDNEAHMAKELKNSMQKWLVRKRQVCK